MLINTHTYQQLCDDLAIQVQQGNVVVLASGIFDLLHVEHKNYLKKAKQAGDILVVAIESDARTRQLKGEGRPMQNQKKRLQNILALPYVDHAFVLPDDFNSPAKYEQLVAELRPSLYACSANSPFLDKKQEMLQKYGGKVVVVHDHNPAVSTTQLIRQEKQLKD